MSAEFDISDLSRRMQGAVATLKHELGGLRTGRASASLVEPVHVDAYGQTMTLNQLATISVPEPRMLSVHVWDKALVGAVDKAIRNANLGLSPTVEGQVLRIRIPELNEQRRKEMAKVAHRYAEETRIAVRHVRRDGLDMLKKQLKDKVDRRGRRETPRERGPETDGSIRRRDRFRADGERNRNHASVSRPDLL